MIYKLIALLTGTKAIVLVSAYGDTYKTFLRKDGPVMWGWARVYPFSGVGFARLNEDGTVHDHYTKWWFYL